MKRIVLIAAVCLVMLAVFAPSALAYYKVGAGDFSIPYYYYNIWGNKIYAGSASATVNEATWYREYQGCWLVDEKDPTYFNTSSHTEWGRLTSSWLRRYYSDGSYTTTYNYTADASNYHKISPNSTRDAHYRWWLYPPYRLYPKGTVRSGSNFTAYVHFYNANGTEFYGTGGKNIWTVQF